MELTNEHREKITEICNYLLVDTAVKRTLFSDQTGQCHYHSSDDSKLFVYLAGEMGFPLAMDHWFEFLVAHLPLAFKKTFAEFNLDLYKEWLCNYTVGNDTPANPIDYLYPEFKRLKRNLCTPGELLIIN